MRFPPPTWQASRRSCGQLRLLVVAIAALTALTGGCGTPEDGGSAAATGADATSQPGGGDALNSGDAVFSVDTGETPDASASEGDDADAADGTEQDAGSGDECPGGAECPCTENSECDKGICIETATGKACARTCVDQCKEGFVCSPFTSPGGDNVLICAPTWDWACDPCKQSAQCKKVGLEGAVCVDYGPDGAFCGVPCADESTCPVGYACKQVQSVEGAGAKQCVRKGGEPLGLCDCSDAAKAKKLSTTCSIAHKDEKGQVTATCKGIRTCGDAGLSKCIGPTPTSEICDGADNDCDGQTDEAACDDNNACTADACDATGGTDGAGTCKHSQLNGPCDADGSVCTEADKCTDGVCVPGTAKNCDDGNTCTLDACDIAAGCTKTIDDGKTCDGDGNPCTVGDVCAQGACATGAPKNCDSNDACVLAKCQPATGKCAFSTKSDQTPCDDGSLCTSSDACVQGFCKGGAVNCDDSNGCTVDSCTDKVGCTHVSTATKCDDGSACTTGDVCTDGKCVGLAIGATECDDGNPCTKDACDPGTKNNVGEGCFSVPQDGVPCDDGDACTGPGACKTGSCNVGAFICACKIDADCSSKGDGNACNGTLFCDKSAAKPVCKLNLATIVTCKEPDKPCLSVSCAAQSGECVIAVHKVGTSCDDNNACTVGDACAGTNPTDATCDPGKKKDCDDSNVCTSDTCDAKTGCASKLDANYKQACYSGPPVTKGVGLCSVGEQTCKADGTLDGCVGEKLPNKIEQCDGKDDNCDGKTDEGCGSAGWDFTQVSTRLSGGTTVQLQARGGAVAGKSTGAGARDIHWGVSAWLSAWSAK